MSIHRFRCVQYMYIVYVHMYVYMYNTMHMCICTYYITHHCFQR